MSDFREGRWLSPDPLGGDVTNPQSLNRYAYVTNNPTTNIDPKGLYLRTPPCGVGGNGSDNCSWGAEFGGWSSHPGVGCSLDGAPVDCALITANGAAVCPNNFCSGFASNGSGQVAYFQASADANGNLGYNQLTPWTYPGLSPEQYLDALNAQLAAVVQGLENKGATDAQIRAFESAVLAQYNSPGGIPLVGGNFDFLNSTVNASGNPSSFDFGCFGGRCVVGNYGFSTLDFSHANGTFHLDTGDPWLPWGAIGHVFVDLYLGNGFYQVIPRPWP